MDDPRAIGELLGGFLVVIWIVAMAALAGSAKRKGGENHHG